MRLEPLLIALALVVVPIGCSEHPVGADLPAILREAAAEDPVQGGSPARRAVRDSLRHVLEADKKYATEIERHFHRPELYSYLFLDESYVGGTFPGGTAVLLREVHRLEDEYLTELQAFPELLATNLAQSGVPAEQRSEVVDEMAGAFTAQRQPIVAVIEKHRTFVEAAAELYELMASQPESIRAMRDGLEISDSRMLEHYDSQVDAVNSAHDAADVALQALDADLKMSLHWMRLERIQR